MRIKELQLLVTPEDLTRFLSRWLKPDRVANLQLSTGEGVLRLRCEYKLGFIPIPVDLTLQVAEIRPDRLELAVTAGGQAGGTLVHDALQTLIRGSRIEALQWENGRLAVRVDRLGPYLRATELQLRNAAFTPGGIALGVGELVLAV